MYTFVVLGLIPGTNIQISFQAWLAMAAVLPVTAVLLKSPLSSLVAIGRAAEPRLPLPATLLHQRVR